MAIRLQSEFADIKGLVYQVNIHDSTYTSAIIPFVIGGDGFVLNYEGDVNDRYKPIIGSFVEFTLMEQNEDHNDFLVDLITAQEGRFLVSIRLDPDGVNTLYWAGVVLPEQMRLQDEAYPIENRIRAADDLANLTNVLYNDNGSAYTNADGMSFAKHLTLALSKMRTASLWASNAPFLRAVASYTPGNIYTGDYYSNLRVSQTTFYNQREDNFENEYFSCHEVLRQFCVPLGARLYLANGYFWFIPVCKAVDSATLSALNYDKEGDYLSTSSVTTGITIGTDINKMKGWSYGYQLPLKKVRRSWLHKGTFPVFAGSWNSATLGSSVISGGEFEYEAGTVFNLQVLCGYQVTGTVTPSSPNNSAIIFQRRVKLRVKVGNYYLKNITTDTTQYFPDGLTYGTYISPVEQSITWTTNSADRYTLSYEPQRYNPNDPTLNILLRTVTLPALPFDLQDVEVTAYFEAYEVDNTLSSTETAAASPTVTVKLDFQNNDKDYVTYAAVSSNDNVTVVDQGEYLIGDAVQTPSFGRIMVKDSSSSYADPTTWTSPALTTGTQDLHTLGVREILFGQSTPRLRQQGQAHLPTQFTVPQMYSTFSYDGRRYALYSMNYMAKDRIQELDMYELFASTAGTTAAEETDGRKNPTRDDIAEISSPKALAVAGNFANTVSEIQVASNEAELFTIFLPISFDKLR